MKHCGGRTGTLAAWDATIYKPFPTEKISRHLVGDTLQSGDSESIRFHPLSASIDGSAVADFRTQLHELLQEVAQTKADILHIFLEAESAAAAAAAAEGAEGAVKVNRSIGGGPGVANTGFVPWRESPQAESAHGKAVSISNGSNVCNYDGSNNLRASACLSKKVPSNMESSAGQTVSGTITQGHSQQSPTLYKKPLPATATVSNASLPSASKRVQSNQPDGFHEVPTVLRANPTDLGLYSTYTKDHESSGQPHAQNLQMMNEFRKSSNVVASTSASCDNQSSEISQFGSPLKNSQNSSLLELVSNCHPSPATGEAVSPVVQALKLRKELRQLLKQREPNAMHVGTGILYSKNTSNWQTMEPIEISGVGLVDGAASVAQSLLCRLPSSVFMRAEMQSMHSQLTCPP